MEKEKSGEEEKQSNVRLEGPKARQKATSARSKTKQQTKAQTRNNIAKQCENKKRKAEIRQENQSKRLKAKQVDHLRELFISELLASPSATGDNWCKVSANIKAHPPNPPGTIKASARYFRLSY